MSDGMSDAYTVGALMTNIQKAVHVFCRAIEKAEEGYRGLTPDWLDTVNEYLGDVGYKLIKVKDK